MKRYLAVPLTLCVLSLLGFVGQTAQASTGTTVSLSPATATVPPGACHQFAATVAGTAEAGLVWAVREGSAGGSISADGLYRAPRRPGTYHVVATHLATGVSGVAPVTVAPEPAGLLSSVSVLVSPSAVTLSPTHTQLFTAQVDGSTNTAVAWSVRESTGGSITAAGVYTAPAAAGTFHVVATAAADPTVKATAVVSVTTGIGVSVLPPSRVLLPRETATFHATVTGTADTRVVWAVEEGPLGGTITNEGVYTAPSKPGTYHVTATSVADPTAKGTAVVTVDSGIVVSVKPGAAALRAGEALLFQATVAGASNQRVTWSVQGGPAGGTITSAGRFTARYSGGTCRVVATSAADPGKSGAATVTVAPATTNHVLPDGSPMAMVLVPAGTFLMGNAYHGDDAALGNVDERPQHQVNLSAYRIGKCEVTRRQYSRFMTAGGYGNRALWSAPGWVWKTSLGRTRPEYWAVQQDWGTGTFTQTSSHPVVGVTYYEAEAFCKWAGLRLPTEAEWEKAARWDGHPRIYPWGDTWDPAKCNGNSDATARTAPVGSYPAGTSPYGCQDMAGNVLEWCRDWYGSYPSGAQVNPLGPTTGTYVVNRGGSWTDDSPLLRTAARLYNLPWLSFVNRGFRCVQTVR